MASGKVEVLIGALVIGYAVLSVVPPEQFLGPVTKYHSLNRVNSLSHASSILISAGSGCRLTRKYAYYILAWWAGKLLSVAVVSKGYMRTIALTLTPYPHLPAPPIPPYLSLMITPHQGPSDLAVLHFLLAYIILFSGPKPQLLGKGRFRTNGHPIARLDDLDSPKRSTKHSFDLMTYFLRCISTSNDLI